ncbi:MAG: major facilitator superfamily transporter [Pedosphaera sp.]|nr:major facilitator superfamily transporter [Pedosphaera sp.]
MSFGFMGIQFGWGLQMANMSSIYEYLHAKPDELPALWLAAPLTGLIIQPIIGHMSDRTWGPLGRRKPYFLIGAILSSLALILMPNSSTLWMAAGLLWILDASINISMEPFRAFVSDLLPEEQRTHGFVVQSLFIGFGSVVASALPWMMRHWFNVSNTTSNDAKIPTTVRYAFYIGAAAFFCAVMWTILRTKEYPPADMAAFKRMKAEKSGIGHGIAEVIDAIVKMPPTMKKLAWVQVFTWLGLFCMWLYFPVAVAHNVFGAPDEKSPLFAEGAEWGGLCSSMYSVVGFAFSFALVGLARRFKRKFIHTGCLICGALGLISVAFIHNKYLLLLSMTGVGIAWASILSLPYAILAGSLPPEKTGVYMGIFNFFIVLPEIGAALGFGWVMNHVLNNSRLAAVVAGGVFMLLAAILMQRVHDIPAEQSAAST